MTATTTTALCPPFCDAAPAGGVECGGGALHRPGWPVGVPFVDDPAVVANDGTTIRVGITDVGGGDLVLSLIIRAGDRETVAPLSPEAAFWLHDNIAHGRARMSRWGDDSPVSQSILQQEHALTLAARTP